MGQGIRRACGNVAISSGETTGSNPATRAGRQPGNPRRRRVRCGDPGHELIGHHLPTRPRIPRRLRRRRVLDQRRVHRNTPRHRHQRRHIRHQIRRRPATHPPIPLRLRRPRHVHPRIQPLPDPRRRLRRLLIAEPTKFPGQLRIHLPPVPHLQTRCLPHDQRGPPLTDHPRPQRRQHVRHLRRQHLRQPHMPATPERRLLTRHRDLRRHTPPGPLIPRPLRRQPRRLRRHERHRQLRLRRRTRRLDPLQLPDPVNPLHIISPHIHPAELLHPPRQITRRQPGTRLLVTRRLDHVFDSIGHIAADQAVIPNTCFKWQSLAWLAVGTTRA